MLQSIKNCMNYYKILKCCNSYWIGKNDCDISFTVVNYCSAYGIGAKILQYDGYH